MRSIVLLSVLCIVLSQAAASVIRTRLSGQSVNNAYQNKYFAALKRRTLVVGTSKKANGGVYAVAANKAMNMANSVTKNAEKSHKKRRANDPSDIKAIRALHKANKHAAHQPFMRRLSMFSQMDRVRGYNRRATIVSYLKRHFGVYDSIAAQKRKMASRSSLDEVKSHFLYRI